MIKYNAFVLAAFVVAAPALAWSTSARAESCVNDIDCKMMGTGCGSQVCSYLNGNPVCVNAGGDPGWCTTSDPNPNSECKCEAQGATCVGTACTITVAPSSGSSSGSSSSGSPSSGSSSGGSPSSGSPTSESGSSSSGTETTSTTNGAGKTTSCTIAIAPRGCSAWALVGVALAGLGMSRRKRK
jgi:hypothetical protein